MRTGFPVAVASGEARGLSVYDMDGDGLLEIIVSVTAQPGMRVFDLNGAPYQPTGTAAWLGGPMANPAWPRYNSAPAPAGDLNRNGGATPGSTGWGQNTGVYDLDGDGLAEVVWPASSHFEVFRIDGYAVDTKYRRGSALSSSSRRPPGL